MDVANLSARAIERRWRGHGEFQTAREVAMAEQRKNKGEDNGWLCVSRREEGHTNLTIDVLSWPHGDYTSRLEKRPEDHADAGEAAAWQHRLPRCYCS